MSFSDSRKKSFLLSIKAREKQLLERFLSFLRKEQKLGIEYFPIEESADYFCFVLCLNGEIELSEILRWQEEFNRRLCEEGEVDRLSSLASAYCWSKQEGKTFLLLEEVLSASSAARSDLVNFIKGRVAGELQIVGSKLLVVTDPYMFRFKPDRDWEFIKEVLAAVLDAANGLEKVVFIVDPDKVNEECRALVESFLEGKGKKMDVVSWNVDAEFHDRFWLFLTTERHCKGFIVGTSLNGIGNKIALADLLSEEDSEELLRLLRAYYKDILPEC